MRVSSGHDMNVRNRLFISTYLCDFTLFLLVFGISRSLAEQDTGSLFLGIAGAAFSLAYGASSLVFGNFSGRFGRRPIVVAGLIGQVLMVAGTLICTEHRIVLLVCYWIAGATAGVIYPAIIGWLTDAHESRRGARGLTAALIGFCLSWNLGMISGQLSGGVLLGIGLYVLLVVALALSITNLIWVCSIRSNTSTGVSVPVSKDNHTEHAPALTQPVRQLSGACAYQAWIANVGGAFCISMILHLFPELAVDLDIPKSEHGAILAVMRVISIATYVCMHHSQFWHYRFSTSAAAHLVGMAGLAIIATADSIAWLSVGLGCLGLLGGYNYFSGLYYSTSGTNEAGFGGGIHEATLCLGLSGGSLLGGLAGQGFGARAPYVLGITVLLILYVFQVVVYFRRIRPVRMQLSKQSACAEDIS